MKLVGITDEITTCDCCGKTNLKKTFAVMDDDGNVNYYGSECYARLMGIRPKDSRIRLDGALIQRVGVITVRQHGHEFYSIWRAGKLLETCPIGTNTWKLAKEYAQTAEKPQVAAQG